jgi:hypothetical protein
MPACKKKLANGRRQGGTGGRGRHGLREGASGPSPAPPPPPNPSYCGEQGSRGHSQDHFPACHAGNAGFAPWLILLMLNLLSSTPASLPAPPHATTPPAPPFLLPRKRTNMLSKANISSSRSAKLAKKKTFPSLTATICQLLPKSSALESLPQSTPLPDSPPAKTAPHFTAVSTAIASCLKRSSSLFIYICAHLVSHM